MCTVTFLSVPLVARTVMPADGSALLVPFAGVIVTADELAGRAPLPLCPLPLLALPPCPPLLPALPEQAATSSASAAMAARPASRRPGALPLLRMDTRLPFPPNDA